MAGPVRGPGRAHPLTRFGVTSLLGAIVLVLFATLDDQVGDNAQGVLLILAAVLVGAFIAVEARHQHVLSLRERRKEDDDDRPV